MKFFRSQQDKEEQERKERAEFEADEEVLENTDDLEEARRVFRNRYQGIGRFTAAQRGYNRPIDEDRLRKVEQRAEDKQH
jgi:hypothetical protein